MEDGGEKFKRVGSQDLSQERGSGGSLSPLSQATATLGEATAKLGEATFVAVT